MKRNYIFVIFLFIITTASAQRARVFEHYNPSYVFGNESNIGSFGYLQTLAIGKKFGFRINAGIRYEYFMFPKTTFDAKGNDSGVTMTFLNRVHASTLNFPLGLEVGNRIVAVGVDADIFGFTFGKSHNASEFTVKNEETENYTDLNVSPRGFNFLPTKKGTYMGLMYLSFTPSQTFSIRGGMAFSQGQYKGTYTLNDNVTNWRTVVTQNFNPFVGIQFNFER